MKRILKVILVLLLITSCNSFSEKRYEDYDENDFVEVQGILVKTIKNTVYPNGMDADIYFIYNLGKEKPDTGYELETPYLGLSDGEPIIVLVHSENPKISFYGSRGIIEEAILLEYLDKCAQIGGDYYGVNKVFSKF